MKKLMLIAAVSSVVFFGCSKDEIIETPIPPNNPPVILSSDFVPLEIGNYWVYDTYKIDTLDNATLHQQSDSAYVSRDTTILGKRYYIVEGDLYAKLGIGNIIRNQNNSIYYYNFALSSPDILFTTNNLGSLLSTDTVANSFVNTTWVNTQQENIVVGAGTFLCYDLETEVTPLQPSYPWGTRNQHRYYKQGIGVVVNQFFYTATPDLYESRLVRYHLN